MANDTVTSNQATTVIANPISGNDRIDVLLESADFRWNYPQPLKTPVEVTYSFMTAAPTYAEAEDKKGFTPFNDAQKTATKDILAQISAQFDVTFKEVADSAGSYGQIRFGNNDQGETSAGYASYPDPSGNPAGGDLYINNQDPANLEGITPGTNAYATLVHEIGHTLGLKHPGNYNAGEAASTAPGNFLAKDEDSEANTIMSYVKTPQQLERDFFGKYDILALDYLYGARSFKTGGDIYSFGNSAGVLLQIINDDGGIDTIDASSATVAATIDLRDSGSSSIGTLADGAAAQDNLTIAFGDIIENAIGSALGDTITGNSSANSITGGAGNDTLDGGDGIDSAVFQGTKSAYTISPQGAGWTIADGTSGRDGTDALAKIERLKFSDFSVALDVGATSNAGIAAKILGAVFGKSEVANKQYAGIGLKYLDSGTSYADLMKLALDVKLGSGFKTSDEVTLLYNNLVGMTPSAADIAYWEGTVASNQFTQTTLAMMAADHALNTDNIQLAGLAATGLEYIPA
ncbi:MAG: hypothetical protein A3H32_17830 [Betaproteobacteria bacterium RIFCSPLOWO2_02_FULL_63_19]|nr:MAG: hypothetical protein A3H32_17830 [Betaproteobacteria bacterium RIFCSPLOWO2_02_FULL_63_19]